MTTRLKNLFQQPELFVLAGGINPIGAKMAEALGYDAFYMSGGNTSAHQLGWPDSGTSMRDMVDNARKIVLTVQIPVFADVAVSLVAGAAGCRGRRGLVSRTDHHGRPAGELGFFE
jgi:2-methylisocitrate lyase-like PEP mutase family enzyme